MITTNTLSFVFVSQVTSICCRRIDTVPAGHSPMHGTMQLRPGFAIFWNAPHFSTILTVPVDTVMQPQHGQSHMVFWRLLLALVFGACLWRERCERVSEGRGGGERRRRRVGAFRTNEFRNRPVLEL